ncbi:hypothetical protein SLEP1_g9973 [Rubroshorea leprosula]|uniref:Malectin-like domain-containing protein n=1 Tax=Rubroshorea leprosula TaxID=152421 RepID=A0AAV5IGH6_9ROSI|nr:hypothetical protein SLEP1_g9973 [Rubroshorea leprosula]
METWHPTLFIFLLSLSTLYHLCFSFSPVDNYLLDCGSAVDSTVDNRLFISDSSASSTRFSSSARTISISAQDHVQGLPQIYNTARVFKAPLKYEFDVEDTGTHMIRLHFHRVSSLEVDFLNSQFHVLVDGFVVLNNFSGGCLASPRVMEYLIWVNSGKLEITFLPAKKSKFGFVNAIEVISAPKDLILNASQFAYVDKIENFGELNKQALEIVHRINVGGPKVTPFNGSLWRTWVPDDEYLKSRDGWERVYSSGRIRYQSGKSSREVCPDNVYNTARVIRSKNASIPDMNLTWEFPVTEGYTYLVRVHFCDIASSTLGTLHFNVYVNGHLAYKNLDLSDATDYVLASPIYADFLVDADHSGVLSLSVGPSVDSMGYAVDAILNGVEIMKINNSMGSLDGKVSAEWVMKKCWPRTNVGVLVPSIAVVCLLLIISMVIHRRMTNSVVWSKLPTDVLEVNPKNGKAQLSVEL